MSRKIEDSRRQHSLFYILPGKFVYESFGVVPQIPDVVGDIHVYTIRTAIYEDCNNISPRIL